MPFKPLESYPIVKCSEDERILCAQRQHLIMFINELTLLIFAALIIPILLLFVAYSLPEITSIVAISPILIFYTILVSLAIFFVLVIFLFLSWYYHFYVITNKAIIDRFSFRIMGPYSEVVFGEKMHVQEIVRKPTNMIYDFLKIHDVYVYFHKLEKEEPFIFKSPQNSQQIEDTIEDLISKSKNIDGAKISV